MIQTTPALSFKKVETFGYSLNGKEFLVCQENQEKCNSSYTQVADTYNGTTVKILSGINGSKAQNKANRPFLKTVDTGWTDRSSEVVSNIVTLWGMADLDNKQTDVYTLSLSDLLPMSPAKRQAIAIQNYCAGSASTGLTEAARHTGM